MAVNAQVVDFFDALEAESVASTFLRTAILMMNTVMTLAVEHPSKKELEWQAISL